MDANERLQRARITLEGLSVGDAFGGFFEFNATMVRLIVERKLPPTPWHYTDDTNMALSVFQILRQQGEIDQDALAASFAEHFDPMRGYGVGVRTMLSRMSKGEPWRDIAQEMFWGEGSFGNGGAMRIAPLGAYFANDLDKLVEQTILATEVTHTHTEGIAGAIAIAVATAYAWRMREEPINCEYFITQIIPHIPEGEVYDGVRRARDLPPDITVEEAATVLGNGSRVSAQDTVPFVLWCAGHNLNNFEEAIWQSASALGDVDTTCAMVGGIVASHTGLETVPIEWQRHRERLPEWALSASSE
jgi:ADP-ribosylglycohydrolase